MMMIIDCEVWVYVDQISNRRWLYVCLSQNCYIPSSWAAQAQSEAREVFPWELYPLDNPPRPSRPKAGLGLVVMMMVIVMMMVMMMVMMRMIVLMVMMMMVMMMMMMMSTKVDLLPFKKIFIETDIWHHQLALTDRGVWQRQRLYRPRNVFTRPATSSNESFSSWNL